MPPSERDRLQEIADLAPFTDDVRDLLADLPAAAARRLGTPVGLVNIVLDRALHVAASHGVTGWMSDTEGAPLEWSFCRHVVTSQRPVFIPDAEADPREARNPVVHLDGVRAYGGVPLRSSRGHVLGSMCVIGPAPRAFGDDDRAFLETLADEAVRRIEAYAAARRADA